MDNQDVSRVKAKGRVELLFLFLMLVLVVGGVAEYRHAVSPMSSATVIFDYNETEGEVVKEKVVPSATIKAPLEAKAPVSELNAPKAQDIAIPEVKKENVAEPSLGQKLAQSLEKSQQDVEVKENNSALTENEKAPENKEAVQSKDASSHDGAAELTQSLQEIHQKAENISRPQSALGQIKERPLAKPVQAQPQPVFEAGKIEIYDSDKGVVAVQESVEVIATPKAETPETHTSQSAQNVQTVSNSPEVAAKEAEPLVVKTDETIVKEVKPSQDKAVEQVSQAVTVAADAKANETKPENTSQEAKVVEEGKEASYNQPTLLVPVAREGAEPLKASIKEEANKENLSSNASSDNAPVDMIKALQDKKERLQDNVQKTVSEKVELVQEKSQNIQTALDEKKALAVQASEEVASSVQAREEQVKRSQKANEALENLFKKMSEPNALNSSSVSVETDASDKASLGEKASESVKDENSSVQPVENNVKNSSAPSGENADAGAVDLMKAIVSRK